MRLVGGFWSRSKVLLGLILVFRLAWPSFAEGQKVKVGSHGKVLMGSTVLRQGEKCTVLGAALSAEKFLEGLERLDTPAGSEFRSGSVRVTRFPDEVLVQVGAGSFSCDAGFPVITIPGASDDFVRGLRFEVRWKTGGKTRPAEVLSLEPYHPPMQAFDDRSFYYLKVRAKGIPLTDHLVLTIFSKGGKRLTRLSARL